VDIPLNSTLLGRGHLKRGDLLFDFRALALGASEVLFAVFRYRHYQSELLAALFALELISRHTVPPFPKSETMSYHIFFARFVNKHLSTISTNILALRSKDRFEHLLPDGLPPLGNRFLLDQPESRTLIEVMGRFQTSKRPQVDPPIPCGRAKAHRFIQQSAPDSLSLESWVYDKPPEANPRFRVRPRINGNGSAENPLHRRRTKEIGVLSETAYEVRQLSTNLRFERDVKTPVLMVVSCVEFDYLSQNTGEVSFRYHPFLQGVWAASPTCTGDPCEEMSNVVAPAKNGWPSSFFLGALR
jgi:hypothetical protein